MGKLKEVKLEMEESICELEQGEILGESEDYTKDKEWRSSEDLMGYWDSSKQHEEMLTKDEDLKTKTSSETKRSDGFKSDNLCMFAGETCEGQFTDIVIKEEEDKKNIYSILEEDEIDRSHIQLGKYIKKACEGLDEIEEETIEEFLNHIKDLEQQGDMMAETLSDTSGSYVFKTDSFSVDVEQMKDNTNVVGETRIAL